MEMRFIFPIFFLSIIMAIGITFKQVNADNKDNVTIAFGSCLRQWVPQPIWEGVSSVKPDAFIFLGDNVYTDIGWYLEQEEPERIKLAYLHLISSEDFKKFLYAAKDNNTSLFAIWDDHDYGRDDSGADYEYKLDSKKYFQEYFLDLFSARETVTGRDQPGIYRSEYLDLNGMRIQLLLLDTRSFRSELVLKRSSDECPRMNTGANIGEDATILGDAQWSWLEEELMKPADIRILASSIQMLPTEHCYEKWANFPNERKKLINLLKDTKAQGVIMISGDRHLGEMSVLNSEAIGYPLYEITSSNLNLPKNSNGFGVDEHNNLRITKDNVLLNNFGTIQIIRQGSDIELKLQLRDVNGNVLQETVVPLETLKN